TVVNSALLEPLPFPQPDRLVVLSHRPADNPHIGGLALTDHTFYELRAVPSRAFASLATDAGKLMTVTGSGNAEQLQALQVTANLMSTLGVSPAIGRTFTGAEEEPGNGHVVILSDHLWRERFGGARSVLGTSITLDGVAYIVVGVMPPTF